MNQSWIISKNLTVLLLSLTILLPIEVLSATKIGIPVEKIWVSRDPFFAGERIYIATLVVNPTPDEFSGIVEFRDGTTTIASEHFTAKSFSAGEVVRTEWLVTEGKHAFSAIIVDPQVNGKSSTTSLASSDTLRRTAERDNDGDRIGNIMDTDDDNDGLLDVDEIRKKTDPNNPDSDADGLLDGNDAEPLSRATSTVATLLSTSTVNMLENFPETARGPVTTTANALEGMRAEEIDWVNKLLGTSCADITRLYGPLRGTSTDASTTPVFTPLIPPTYREGWKMLEESIKSGNLLDSPYIYAQLFFGLIYKFLLSYPIIFYGIGILIIIKVIAMIVGRLRR